MWNENDLHTAPPRNWKFLFDFDGTLSTQETLPLIGRHFGLVEEIQDLTFQTIRGEVPFQMGFRKRLDLLKSLPLEEIRDVLRHVEVDSLLADFLSENTERCAVVSGNIGDWIAPAIEGFCGDFWSSKGEFDSEGYLLGAELIDKAAVVRGYQEQGFSVVFVGDGNNDAEALEAADIGVAAGMVHYPAPAAIDASDYVVFESRALVRLLHSIIGKQSAHSVVISAAGVGSRLGLNQTKALVKIGGMSNISRILRGLGRVPDVRVVAGFQWQDLVSEVLANRRDVIFVFNREYRDTGTGWSFSLGARWAGRLVSSIDGDLVVSPNDLDEFLGLREPVIGLSKIRSAHGVRAEILGNDCIDLQISSDWSDTSYEWPGLVTVETDKFVPGRSNVFELVAPMLPMRFHLLEAMDFDNLDDLCSATDMVDGWDERNSLALEYYDELSTRPITPLITRNVAPDFSKFDVELVQRFSGSEKSLLDLGAGTGLLVNPLKQSFSSIVAVEKYGQFAEKIQSDGSLAVEIADLLCFSTEELFDVVTLFGVMNFFSDKEAELLYSRISGWLRPKGLLIVKNQMGVEEDVIVDGFSEELGMTYSSKYRSSHSETRLIEGSYGLRVKHEFDPYPDEFNRWPNTRFKALVAEKID